MRRGIDHLLLSRQPLRGGLTALALCLAGIGPARAQLLAPNLLYNSIQPCRLIDTRVAGGALAAGVTRTFNAVGVNGGGFLTSQGGNPSGCPIPGFASGVAQVQAVAVNFIAVGAAGPGDLVAWPSDNSRPHASIVNYASQSALSGLNIANAIILPVRQDAQGNDISVLAQVAGTHLVADVVGYFSSGSPNQTGTGTGTLSVGPSAGDPFGTTGSNNTAFGVKALSVNLNGSSNTAVGAGALLNNSSGNDNTAVGLFALENSASGIQNTAVGSGALGAVKSNQGNTAVGYQALQLVTASDFSTAFGWAALQSATGTRNTAVGAGALQNLTTGTENVALGVNAGVNYTGGETNNILLGGENNGVAGETKVIRIGNPNIYYNSASIGGIFAGVVNGSDYDTVLVDSTGLLGTAVSSSIHFKEDVRDMGEASDALMRLRPVTFHYKARYDDGSHRLQYGLIAEEVAKVIPGLVRLDAAGEPLAVRYQWLPPLLLNEAQKQHRQIATDHATIEAQQSQIDELRGELAKMAQRLAELTPSPSPSSEQAAPKE